jgi:hypothetical protein
MAKKPSKKSTTKKTSSREGAKKLYTTLFILALVLPLVGWGIGARLNPEGWMSNDPLIPYLYAYMFAVTYWPVTLAAIFLIIVYLRLYIAKAGSLATFKTLSVLAFIVSLLFSIIIMTVVRDADSSEFTG